MNTPAQSRNTASKLARCPYARLISVSVARELHPSEIGRTRPMDGHGSRMHSRSASSGLPPGAAASGDEVYRRSDGVAHAKLASTDRLESLDGERRRTEWLFAMEIPVPRVFDWIQSDRHACLVTASLPGVPASDLLSPELQKVWPPVVRQLEAIHALPVDDCPFELCLSAMADRAVNVIMRGAVNPAFMDAADRAVPPATLLAALQTELPARLAQERDDLADRYADLALILANAKESWASEECAVAAEAELFDNLGLFSRPGSARLLSSVGPGKVSACRPAHTCPAL